ncbi:hypothetical protein RB25_11635 [Herbaspirillum rubrisubalbicans]|uniref:FliH/SctL family protein n=1 Tax=Herbaspirillum rubrisubalbicans TaxID=80842 RepID=UPI000DC4DB97|nr:FliH/SctL family protein [Herbaspirillum rubrisubalbicans]RAN48429.1 hypothetical protein RB25_11635 [Herbaspirillum rubrisubalbicans]
MMDHTHVLQAPDPVLLRNADIHAVPLVLPRSPRPDDRTQPLPTSGQAGVRQARDSSQQESVVADERDVLSPRLRQEFMEACQRGVEQGRLQGMELGRTEGYERGMAEARSLIERQLEETMQAHRQSMQARTQQLDQLLTTLAAAIGERIEAAHDDVLAICYAATCRVLGEHLVQPAVVAGQVKKAIQECCNEWDRNGSGAAMLAVHMHPQDIAHLKQEPSMQQWLLRPAASLLQWHEDAQIQLGGCIVRTSHGSLDARMETQLLALQEAMLSARRQSLPTNEKG